MCRACQVANAFRLCVPQPAAGKHSQNSREYSLEGVLWMAKGAGSMSAQVVHVKWPVLDNHERENAARAMALATPEYWNKLSNLLKQQQITAICAKLPKSWGRRRSWNIGACPGALHTKLLAHGVQIERHFLWTQIMRGALLSSHMLIYEI